MIFNKKTKLITLAYLFYLATASFAYAEENPFAEKKPAPATIAPHSVETATTKVDKKIIAVEPEINALSKKDIEMNWIYQLKSIGLANNIEILKNESDNCLIKKSNNNPVDSICLRNYLERMRRSDNTEVTGSNKRARPN